MMPKLLEPMHQLRLFPAYVIDCLLAGAIPDQHDPLERHDLS
jgi:hypothetical protein